MDAIDQADLLSSVDGFCGKLWDTIFHQVASERDGSTVDLGKVAEAIDKRYGLDLDPMVDKAKIQLAEEEAEAQAEKEEEEGGE